MFGLIVTFGIVSRYWLIDEPNFKPVGALALFAGFYFRQARWGIVTLLVMMLATDLVIGFYEPMMMLAVYGSLTICCGLGWCCRRFLGETVDFKLVLGFGGASVVMSLCFFALTNFAVWVSGAWYPLNSQGLVECFTAAIPFFRNTLTSDLLFSQSIVLSYGFARIMFGQKCSSATN